MGQSVTTSASETPTAWEQARLAHRDDQAASIAAGALSLVAEHGASALTMSAVAEQAGVSRQTLYRYFPDIDAVLVAAAELVAAHDQDFDQMVADLSDPIDQIDLIAEAVCAPGHAQVDLDALGGLLTPRGRSVLAEHHDRSHRLIADVLERGVEDGRFRVGLQPEADAPLVLGLLRAADPDRPERAIALVHHLVLDPDTSKEPSS